MLQGLVPEAPNAISTSSLSRRTKRGWHSQLKIAGCGAERIGSGGENGSLSGGLTLAGHNVKRFISHNLRFPLILFAGLPVLVEKPRGDGEVDSPDSTTTITENTTNNKNKHGLAQCAIAGEERTASSKLWLSLSGKRDVRKNLLVWLESLGFSEKRPEPNQGCSK